MSDAINLVFSSKDHILTKTWKPGVIEPYGDEWRFLNKPVEVGSLKGLAKLLDKYAKDPHAAIIRGRFKGDAEIKSLTRKDRKGQTLQASIGEGICRRWLECYDDLPLHFCMLDIDGFKPAVDPNTQTETALDEFIQRWLPPEFQGVDYYYRLSSSAGAPGKEGVLKCHLFYWLKTPYNSRQMKAWAKSVGPAIDSAVFNPVQLHFIADPVFDGVADPIAVRGGYVEGWSGADEVDLVLNDVILLRAEEQAEGSEIDLVDPTEKPGLIGAFCRAYTMEEVIENWLSDQFEFAGGSDYRLNWLNGGGAPEGAFITPDREYIVNKHNTDPLDNRATNKFDLVRHYVYGVHDEGVDPFELLDMPSRPSYLEMLRDIELQPEVQAEVKAGAVEAQVEARTLRDSLVDDINAAADEAWLRETVCQNIKGHMKELERADVKIIATAIAVKFKALTGTKLSIDEAKELVRPDRVARREANVDVPQWAQNYVYVKHRSLIYEYDNGTWLGRTSIEFMHNRMLGVDEEGYQISAWNVLKDHSNIAKVDLALYMPAMEPTFTYDGASCVNTYCPSSVPMSKPYKDWTEADHAAVARALRHIQIICNDRPEVYRALLDWLAFCVQNPGVKINFTWLIQGGEGTGKSWVGNLMSLVMGHRNVKMVSIQEILDPKFNGWVEGACFAVIEEVRIPGHKQDAWNNMKAPLTNPIISVSRKGIDSFNAPNIGNYLVLSNFKDAVPIGEASRRVGVIFMPFDGDETFKQLDEMAVREGYKDAEEYFNGLFAILSESGPALREWLLTYAVSAQFNPKGRAPYTTEKSEMISGSMPHEEQLIRDAIADGSEGVSAEVVSPASLVLAVQFGSGDSALVTPERAIITLRKMGYSSYPRRIKWKTNSIRVWIKGLVLGETPEEQNMYIRSLLDKTSGTTPKANNTTGTTGADEDFMK